MFTGLVEELGGVKAIRNVGQGLVLSISAEKVVQDLALGDSVCVNGVCLTVVDKGPKRFDVEAVGETLSRSTLAALKVGSHVNLERSLRADSRLGGHFVQGHVDGTGTIVGMERKEPGVWLRISVPNSLLPLVVEKGSIALDGISLTVAAIEGNIISVAVIPFTLKLSTLSFKKTGDKMNIETDILGKYIYRFLNHEKDRRGLDFQKLTEWGF